MSLLYTANHFDMTMSFGVVTKLRMYQAAGLAFLFVPISTVAYVGIPAFIVTLAGMLFFRGANQWIGDSQSIPVPKEFVYIGAGYLPELAIPLDFNVLTISGLGGVTLLVLSRSREGT